MCLFNNRYRPNAIFLPLSKTDFKLRLPTLELVLYSGYFGTLKYVHLKKKRKRLKTAEKIKLYLKAKTRNGTLI